MADEAVMMEVKRRSSRWVWRWLIMWRELVLQDDVVDDILTACLITHQNCVTEWAARLQDRLVSHLRDLGAQTFASGFALLGSYWLARGG